MMFQSFKAIFTNPAWVLCALMFMHGITLSQQKKDTADPWLGHPHWDEGKAEILGYNLSDKRYGEMRKGKAVWVLVKEDHLPELYVKKQTPGGKSVPMLKFLQEITLPTGVYTYRQSLVSLIRKDTGAAPRTVFSSQEWCGLTFKDLLIEPGSIRMEYNSYWQDEGVGSLSVETTETVLPYNALPIFFRRMVHGGAQGPRTLHFFDDLISNKVGTPQIQKITVDFKDKDAKLVEVSYRALDGIEKLHIQKTFPNKIVRWEKEHTFLYELKDERWTDYWKQNKVKDESLRFGPTF